MEILIILILILLNGIFSMSEIALASAKKFKLESIEWKDFVFEIVDMDARRIDKVMIHKPTDNPDH